jgi:homoserine kinase
MSTTAVAAYAPGSIGNMGPGLDVLGCAVTGAGDVVRLEWSDGPAQSTIRVDDPGHAELPRDESQHAAAIAAMAVLRRVGDPGMGRLVMRATKGLPLAGGQGGSAASAVAGAVAMNTLLGSPLDERALLGAALEAESAVAGRHADNVAPALLGGVILVRSVDPLDLVRLPYPAALRIVLVQPEQRLPTAQARAVLPNVVERAVAVRQSANVAAMVAALTSGDLDLLRRALDDGIAEPARAPLLPGFREAKAAALDAGALGCSISGAGPTSFAFAPNDGAAAIIGAAMCAAYRTRGVGATSRVARIDEQGARLL